MRIREVPDEPDKASVPKPYAMLGAGKLAATLWKAGSESSGWRYRYNVFRLSPRGHVGQKFRPGDLKHLVRLAHVLASTLSDDGCLSPKEREELSELASKLRVVTDRR